MFMIINLIWSKFPFKFSQVVVETCFSCERLLFQSPPCTWYSVFVVVWLSPPSVFWPWGTIAIRWSAASAMLGYTQGQQTAARRSVDTQTTSDPKRSWSRFICSFTAAGWSKPLVIFNLWTIILCCHLSIQLKSIKIKPKLSKTYMMCLSVNSLISVQKLLFLFLSHWTKFVTLQIVLKEYLNFWIL